MKGFPMKEWQYYWAKTYCGLEHSMGKKFATLESILIRKENIWEIFYLRAQSDWGEVKSLVY